MALEWAWQIRVTELALRIRLRNLNLISPFSIFDSFRDMRHIYNFFGVCGRFMGVRVEVCGRFMGVRVGGKHFFINR